MAEHKAASKEAYIAVESFVANVNGLDKAYYADRSIVYEGDPILTRCPDYFVPARLHTPSVA